MLSGESPTGLIVGVNAAAWLIIHLGSVYLSNRIRIERFDANSWPFRTRRWERQGQVYATWLRVKRWKNLLPDGARMSRKAFTIKRFTSRSPAYLKRYISETCRAELCHWLALAVAPMFFLWNPWYVAVLMLPYAIAVNMPCIISQRYNRPRMLRMLRLHAGTEQQEG
jgi:glycosyl-4,4'-diaponeurosporenoate acyltransferase